MNALMILQTHRHIAFLATVVLGMTSSVVAQSDPTMMPTEKAIALFQSRLEKHDDDYASRTILGRLHLRRASEADEFADYVAAENHFRKALRVNPDYTAAKTYLANALLAQHRFNEAAELAQDLIQARPNSTLAMATLADALFEVGRWDEAAQALEKLMSLSDSPPVLVRLARLEELHGDYKAALSLLLRAVSDQEELGGQGIAWYKWRVGRCCLDHGRLDDAQRWFEKALESKSNDPHAIAGLAFIHSARGENEAAIARYLDAVKQLSSPPLMSALGDVYHRSGDAEQAKHWWDRAEATILEEAGDASSRIAHSREAATFFSNHNRNLQLAIELARVDLQQRPGPEAFDTLAWALHQAGQSDEARQWMRRAVDAAPSHAMIQYHAGIIAHKRGDHPSAIAHLERALSINPHFSPREIGRASELLRTLKADAS